MDNQEKVNRDFLNVAEYYYAAFGFGPGAKVLDHLQTTLEGSNLMPNGACDFQCDITPEQLMFMREGQQQVLRHIKNMMKYFKENRNG